MDNYKDKLSIALLPKIKGWCISEGNIDGLVRCIVEEMRKNPDPAIVAKAFEVESKHYLELSNYLDTGMDMTPDEYVEYIIQHWNDEEKSL